MFYNEKVAPSTFIIFGGFIMKEFGKMIIKNAAISAACTIGTFGGLIALAQIMSEFEKFKKRKSIEVEDTEEEDEA